MKLEIEVRRTRRSVTQGEAGIYINGHFVISYADDIQMVTRDAPVFGENIGGWASTKPDMFFIRGLLSSDYPIRDKLNAVLASIETEERGDDPVGHVLKKQRDYIAACGGIANIREADEIYIENPIRGFSSYERRNAGRSVMSRNAETRRMLPVETRKQRPRLPLQSKSFGMAAHCKTMKFSFTAPGTIPASIAWSTT